VGGPQRDRAAGPRGPAGGMMMATRKKASRRKAPRTRAKATARPSARPPVRLQLRWLAHARSGDKGDTANVGLIALKPEWYPVLVKEVTRARVSRHFRGMVTGVDRFELPN